MMWSDRCRWSRAVKSGVSCFFACAVIAVLLPFTLPPERAAGGVQLVSNEPVAELYGPKQDESDEGIYEVYVQSAIKPPSVIIEPTPEPDPIYVYCNNGGKNYHAKDCRFVKRTTPRVTLWAAVYAGYSQCPKCEAPPESMLNN